MDRKQQIAKRSAKGKGESDILICLMVMDHDQCCLSGFSCFYWRSNMSLSDNKSVCVSFHDFIFAAPPPGDFIALGKSCIVVWIMFKIL